jgi:glycerol-3-phosphate dehydrogenase
MNVGLAVTAAVHGASVANHVEVVELLKKEEADGKSTVCGAKIRDTLTGEVFDVNARVVVNATGPYVGSYQAERL